MIKVSFEVGSGSASFGAAVRAESIRQAVDVAEARYPGCDVRVVFPIDPEAFFVRGPAGAAGTIELEIPQNIAG